MPEASPHKCVYYYVCVTQHEYLLHFTAYETFLCLLSLCMDFFPTNKKSRPIAASSRGGGGGVVRERKVQRLTTRM